jgi:pimeloyl-ACP methyl ester carboxylesterase
MNAVPLAAASQPSVPLTYSLQDHWITLDGARMRYLHDGVGDPLILLHGLLGYSFSWRYAIPALAKIASVHAVDMLGTGFSDRPKGLDSCLRACAERLLRFMDAAGMASCDLLGTSHGGGVALRAAAIAPERIRRLILVAPINPWSSKGRFLAALLGHPIVAPILLRIAPRLTFTHSFLLRRLYGDPQRIRPGTLQGYTTPFTLPRAFDHPLQILSSWHADLAELETVLPRVSGIPTLLVWGELDNAVDPASASLLSRYLPKCETVMLQGVGHLPYEEVPDEFNRVVQKFLGPD